MPRKTILVAGATGLVGYAAMKHFGREAGTRVIALSRRRPDETFGAEWLPLDLGNAPSCHAAAAKFRDVTHLVYAALYERPGLVAGWREDEQIRTNDLMLRNLLGPLESASAGLRHVALLQGTKAYGVHVRPLLVPARENRSEMHEQPNFYWNQERYLRGIQNGRPWHWTILRPVLIVGSSVGSAMNVIPALGAYAALQRRAGKTRLEAFKNLAARTKVDDVRALVAMLVQTDRFGTSIGQALRTHSETARGKRRQRDWMVASTRAGEWLTSRNSERLGGSSTTFSSALAALTLRVSAG